MYGVYRSKHNRYLSENSSCVLNDLWNELMDPLGLLYLFLVSIYLIVDLCTERRNLKKHSFALWRRVGSG